MRLTLRGIKKTVCKMEENASIGVDKENRFA